MKIARDLTPPEAQCFPLPGCPAILQITDGTFAIIGREMKREELPPELQSKVGDGEVLAILPATFGSAFKQ